MSATSDTFSTTVREAGGDAWKRLALEATAERVVVEMAVRNMDMVFDEDIGDSMKLRGQWWQVHSGKQRLGPNGSLVAEVGVRTSICDQDDVGHSSLCLAIFRPCQSVEEQDDALCPSMHRTFLQCDVIAGDAITCNNIQES